MRSQPAEAIFLVLQREFLDSFCLKDPIIGCTVYVSSLFFFSDNVLFSSHPSLALSSDDQTRVRYAGQPARSPPYSSRLPTAARTARSAPRLALPPPYTLPAKDSALLLLPAEKKRSRFKAPRRGSGSGGGGGEDEGGEYGGKAAVVEDAEAADYIRSDRKGWTRGGRRQTRSTGNPRIET